jgi:hypothetical protein
METALKEEIEMGGDGLLHVLPPYGGGINDISRSNVSKVSTVSPIYERNFYLDDKKNSSKKDRNFHRRKGFTTSRVLSQNSGDSGDSGDNSIVYSIIYSIVDSGLSGIEDSPKSDSTDDSTKERSGDKTKDPSSSRRGSYVPVAADDDPAYQRFLWKRHCLICGLYFEYDLAIHYKNGFICQHCQSGDYRFVGAQWQDSPRPQRVPKQIRHKDQTTLGDVGS